jgi:hypothetical protein
MDTRVKPAYDELLFVAAAAAPFSAKAGIQYARGLAVYR